MPIYSVMRKSIFVMLCQVSSTIEQNYLLSSLYILVYNACLNIHSLFGAQSYTYNNLYNPINNLTVKYLVLTDKNYSLIKNIDLNNRMIRSLALRLVSAATADQRRLLCFSGEMEVLPPTASARSQTPSKCCRH